MVQWISQKNNKWMVKRKLGQTIESSTMEDQRHQPRPEILDLAYRNQFFRVAMDIIDTEDPIKMNRNSEQIKYQSSVLKE